MSKRVAQILGHLAPQSGSPIKAAPTHAVSPNYEREIPKVDGYEMLTKGSGKQSLKGKTVFITGASRGIGLAIGLRCARDGANVVIAAKTAQPHPRLPGTIHTAAEEIKKAGGKALAVECDIRFEDQVKKAIQAAVDTFGGIDILVNNASAIHLTSSEETDMKRFDLMHGINARGTFMVSKYCIPHLKKSSNPHILNISPPLSMDEKWFGPHLPYTWAKMGMSIVCLGLAGELRSAGIAVNTLWPLTTIATAAVQNLLGGDEMTRRSRTAEIMSDAAHAIFTTDSKLITGNYFIDERVMRALGIKDFSKYAVTPGMPDSELAPDFFV